MDKLKTLVKGLRNEEEVGKFWAGAVHDSKLGVVPVWLFDLKNHDTCLMDEVLVHRILNEAMDLPPSVQKILVYYVDITDKDEIEDSIRYDGRRRAEIEFMDLKEVLDDVVVGDYAEFTCEKAGDDLLGGYVVTIRKFVNDRVARKIDEYNQKAFENSTAEKPHNPILISDAGLELIEHLSLDCTSATGPWHSDAELKIDKTGRVILNGQKTRAFWDATLPTPTHPLRFKLRNICGDESVYVV